MLPCSGHGNQTNLEAARACAACAEVNSSCMRRQAAAGSCACEAEHAGALCQRDCCGALESRNRTRIEAGDDGLESCADEEVCSCGGLRFCAFYTTWRLGSPGYNAGGIPHNSCNTVCSEAGLECRNGDWGAHDEASLRAAFVAARANLDDGGHFSNSQSTLCRQDDESYNLSYSFTSYAAYHPGMNGPWCVGVARGVKSSCYLTPQGDMSRRLCLCASKMGPK